MLTNPKSPRTKLRLQIGQSEPSHAVQVPTPSNKQIVRFTPKANTLEYSSHPPTPGGTGGQKPAGNTSIFFGGIGTESAELKKIDKDSAGLKFVNNLGRKVPTPSLVASPEEEVDHNFDFSALKKLTYIASGEYANVFRGTWGEKRVAVKFLKDEYVKDPRASGDMEFEKKVLTLCRACPYIVNIYGSGNQGTHPFIVMEDLPNGTLQENFPKYCTFKSKVNVLLRIAEALEFIHTSCLPHYIIIHRDIKPNNIALDANNVPKLLDFGLARVMETRPNMKSPKFPMMSAANSDSSTTPSTPPATDSTETTEMMTSNDNASDDFDEVTFNMTGETGSLRYMAPEVCLNDKYNHKADVYSFAVLAWQIMTKATPYSGMGVDTFKMKVIVKGNRMPVPNFWPPGLKNLVQQCWSQASSERPNLRLIVSTLKKIREELEGANANATAMQGGCGCAIL